jgi:hypothetical protein
MGADVYISGPGFWYDRSALEDDIEEWLGDRGEVTGGGSGKDGWDIDICLAAERVTDDFLNELLAFLRGLDAPPGVKVTVVEHTRRVYHL